MSDKKINIKGKNLSELQEVVESIGEKKFRAVQLYNWIYEKGSTDFSAMSTFSKSQQNLFDSHFSISQIQPDEQFVSIDGTAKFLWKLSDSNKIESVLIPDDDRLTACVSSQVGCALACAFCATGKMGLTRNLNAGEIYDQVYQMNQWALKNRGQKITNIVFMGMGEPMMNLDEVQKSVSLIANEVGVSISAKRITVSTAGVAHKIKQLADTNPKTKLAISIHSAIGEKRNQIMPINKGTDLLELTDAIRYYTGKTEQRVTYEYVLFNDFNDGLEDAKALAKLCKAAPSKVNIIMYNPVKDVALQRATNQRLNDFIEFLVNNHITVSVRQSRGQDIDAACGQLATKNKKKEQEVGIKEQG